ncbi:MAG TPA: hypothetical protein VHF47_13330 [Acidimicrobiales bacterium]|nr:hypothetical protein [Acidimicrobiales bacterium]
MRDRLAWFAVVALVVAGCGTEETLPKLPVAASGERAAAPVDAAVAPVVHRVEGELPDGPDRGPAYALRVGDPGGARAAVAAALGKEADGVSVADGPGAPWQVNMARDTPIQSGPPCPTCEPVPRAPGLLSDEAAERRAREILGRLGVTGGEAEVRQTPVSVEVTIRPTVDGLPTRGYEHHLSLGLEGIPIGAYGWLGRPERLGDYPLVDVDEALDRLRKGAGPRTLRAEVQQEGLCPEAGACPEGTDAQEVVLTGVRLGLQLVEGHLVPSFFFDVADGDGPVVVAVADRFLDEVQPEPEPAPRPEPDGGACSGTGGAAPSGDQPLTVQVCGASTAAVGEEVAFAVTASDPDAEIVESGCGAPHALFGDEEGVVPGDCMPACAAPLKEGKPGRLARTFRHAYERPGTFTARFRFRSALCTKGSSQGEATHTIVVR